MSAQTIQGTKIYQGWRYTFNEAQPPRSRWHATFTTKLGVHEVTASSEGGLRLKIDNRNEEFAEGALA